MMQQIEQFKVIILDGFVRQPIQLKDIFVGQLNNNAIRKVRCEGSHVGLIVEKLSLLLDALLICELSTTDCVAHCHLS